MLVASLALVIGLAGGYAVSQVNKSSVMPESSQIIEESEETGGWGRGQNGVGPNRGNCLADDCLAVSDLEYPVGELTDEVKAALDEAINDEYKAMSTYQAVMDKFGEKRPFAMIIGAELQHIASLTAIYQKYGLAAPENSWEGKAAAPATFQEACQTGVDAEIANAALYKDKLIPAVSGYTDITQVFTNLMNASETKHLPAFERCN